MDTTLEQVIDDVHTHFSRLYLGAIPQLLNDEGAFLSFICVCSGIEALAGYRHPEEKNGLRFQKFVTEYFLPPYKSLAEELWLFRNSMVHAFNPGKYFALAHHKSQLHFRKETEGRTVLNAEDFYAALLAATQAYFQHLRSSDIPQEAFKKRAAHSDGGLLRVGPLSLD